MEAAFDRLAGRAAVVLGRSYIFAVLLVLIGVWLTVAALSPWAEAINAWVGAITGAVSLILLAILQNSANRASLAVQVKLDAILAAIPAVDNALVAIEDRTEEQILALRAGILSCESPARGR